MRFLGGPRRYEDSGGAPTREFGPIIPSDEADMCRFLGLKVFSEENPLLGSARTLKDLMSKILQNLKQFYRI